LSFFEILIKEYIILSSALFSWIIAQFLKIIIEITRKKDLRTKDFILRALFGTGGMPSSHSATISAVALSIGLREGFNSSIFAFSVVMVIIVIRDATGVRFSAGKQAEALNKILSHHQNEYKIPFDRVKEVRGHTPLESFVGAIVGVLVSLGMYFID
jgi:acid phosphatase family membrane protein YuiD